MVPTIIVIIKKEILKKFLKNLKKNPIKSTNK